MNEHIVADFQSTFRFENGLLSSTKSDVQDAIGFIHKYQSVMCKASSITKPEFDNLTQVNVSQMRKEDMVNFVYAAYGLCFKAVIKTLPAY